MIIPYQQLSADALKGLIQAFILREGTDYGEVERSFEAKIDEVKTQITTGQVLVVFDVKTETASLVNRADYRMLEQQIDNQTRQPAIRTHTAERQQADSEYWEFAQQDYGDDSGGSQ